jgi:small-conductance mechanosensitive channel
MDLFGWVYYGNTVQTWIAASAVTAATLVLLVSIKRITVGRLAAKAHQAGAERYELALDLLRGTRWYFLLALAVSAGTFALDLPGRPARLVSLAVLLAALFQIAGWGSRLIAYAISRYVKSKMEEDAAAATTVSAFGFLARLALWTVIVFIALDNLGVNITALVAGLGVGGIAVALATQNILGDLFASFSIVLDKPFVIGDFIIVGEYLGTVERIGLKTTRIRSLSGEQIIFSNSDLLGSRVRNFKRMYERRIVFSVGVVYQTTREQVAAIPAMLRESIEAQELARFDRAHFKAFGDYALQFEAVYFVRVPDFGRYMDTQQAINLEIMRRFEEAGIEFAYPTQVIYVARDQAPVH